MRRPSPMWVFAVAVLGIATFSAMDAVMKDLVLKIGAYTSLFWRSWAGVIVSGAIYVAMRPPRPTSAAMKLHVIRGAISAIMAVTFFWGLARVPMAQAVALTFIAPILSLFLSSMMLGEAIGRTTILASCVALAGVGIILVGQWHADLGPAALRGSLAVLFSSLCYAFNIVLMRRQALLAGAIEVAFSQSLVVALCLSVCAPFLGAASATPHLPLILLAAMLAVGSLLLLAWAYARGEANHLSPSEYSAFLWAATFGWLVFGERVAAATWLGAVLIVAGCALAARRPIPPIEVGSAC